MEGELTASDDVAKDHFVHLIPCQLQAHDEGPLPPLRRHPGAADSTCFFGVHEARPSRRLE